MTPEQQRIKLAEWDGWIWHGCYEWEQSGDSNYWKKEGAGNYQQLPDYLSDLKAVHELKRKALTTRKLCDRFNAMLNQERPYGPFDFETDKWTWGQSAEVQCRALLKTLGLWEETK